MISPGFKSVLKPPLFTSANELSRVAGSHPDFDSQIFVLAKSQAIELAVITPSEVAFTLPIQYGCLSISIVSTCLNTPGELKTTTLFSSLYFFSNSEIQ
ncbi:Uncharacterised protein [Mesomycoplasma hyorhinis]|nr:Uncharacterised protein [Mesomycoplasma hyorhinis]